MFTLQRWDNLMGWVDIEDGFGPDRVKEWQRDRGRLVSGYRFVRSEDRRAVSMQSGEDGRSYHQRTLHYGRGLTR